MGKNTVCASALLALGAIAGCSDQSDDPGVDTAELGEPASEGSSEPAPPDDGLSTSDDNALPAGSDVPDTAVCKPVALWNVSLASNELRVLSLVNQRRKDGATCGTQVFRSAPALAMSPSLRCAARLHTKDMSDRNYFSHTTPDGVTVPQRLAAVSYAWRAWGENIAKGYPSPEAVVDGWMKSPGHCTNIMNPAFTQIGIAVYGASLWTQDFGTPLK